MFVLIHREQVPHKRGLLKQLNSHNVGCICSHAEAAKYLPNTFLERSEKHLLRACFSFKLQKAESLEPRAHGHSECFTPAEVTEGRFIVMVGSECVDHFLTTEKIHPEQYKSLRCCFQQLKVGTRKCVDFYFCSQ